MSMYTCSCVGKFICVILIPIVYFCVSHTYVIRNFHSLYLLYFTGDAIVLDKTAEFCRQLGEEGDINHALSVGLEGSKK